MNKRHSINKLTFVSLMVLSLGLSYFNYTKFPHLNWEFSEARSKSIEAQPSRPKFQKIFDYTSTAGTAHSPSIRFIDDGFSIFWFDGKRESHEDVVIKQSVFNSLDGKWILNPPEDLLVKEDLSAVSNPKQSIWSLGNVIAKRGDENALFATIVSVGGWAAASIAQVDLENDLPSLVRKLSLSPFLNRSHLVRSPSIQYKDGSTAIPAYFELGNAFGELIRLDDHGRVRDKRRMTQGRFAIQPVIVPLDNKNAVALMRNFDEHTDRLIAVWTEDGGKHWGEPFLLEIPNPNAPVAALLLSTGHIIMAFNDSATDASILKLALSKDNGRNWERIHTLENDQGDARYPEMQLLPNGDILLVYSHSSKKGIKAHIFNEAWIYSQ